MTDLRKIDGEWHGPPDERPLKARQRRALDDAMFPEWTAEAKCAEVKIMSGTGGQIHDDMFKDELSTKKADQGEWPTKVVSAMRLCSECPVRSECLRWAMDQETRFSQRWKTGELVEQDRRFGVYGGVPGRIRERYGTKACPVCGGTGVQPGGFSQPPLGVDTQHWTQAVWSVLGPILHRGLGGWPCTHCKRSGRVPRADRVEQCEAYFERFSRERRWSSETEQRESA